MARTPGECIEALLTKTGMTATDLARHLGVSAQMVSFMRSDQRSVPVERAHLLCSLSEGELKLWELCPTKWHLIWPELIGATGAPEVGNSRRLARGISVTVLPDAATLIDIGDTEALVLTKDEARELGKMLAATSPKNEATSDPRPSFPDRTSATTLLAERWVAQASDAELASVMRQVFAPVTSSNERPMVADSLACELADRFGWWPAIASALSAIPFAPRRERA